VSIRFKAWQLPTGQKGMILLEVDKEDPNVLDWATSFFKEKKEKEKKRDEPIPLTVEIDFWRPIRTPNQWNLAMELLDRYCAKTHSNRSNIMAGIKYATYPDVGEMGQRVKKSSGDLTTVEMAKVIDHLVNMCLEERVDIRDIHTLWKKWRYAQPKDPVEEIKSREEPDVIICEACGKPLNAGTDAAGNPQLAGQMAHVISKGAGGPDEDWNIVWLCTECHIETQHQSGWDELLKQHLSFKDRYDYAMKRWREYQNVKDQDELDFTVPPDFG